MRWKIKVLMIVVFIIIVFLLIKLTKMYKKSKEINIKSLQQSIELFQDKKELAISLDGFRKFHNGRIEEAMEEFKMKKFNEVKFLKFKFNSGSGETKILGPSGICFNPINDDILVLDIYRMKRFLCRDNRVLDKNKNPSLEFKLNEPLEIVFGDIKNNKNKYILKVPSSQVLDVGLINKGLLIAFLKQIKATDRDRKIKNDINGDDISESLKQVERIYKETLAVLQNNPLDIEIKGRQKDSLDGEEFEIYKFTDKKDGTNLLSSKLEQIYNLYSQHYVKVEKCNENQGDSCKLPYQVDMPPFDLKGDRRGIHDLRYDEDPNTIYHPQSVDDIMNPISNSWNTSKYKGIFKPEVSYKKFNADESSLNLREDINENPKTFLLLSEFDNVGVSLYFDKTTNCVMVPDVLNNRIQLLEPSSNGFNFKGQFGNLSYASNRALPEYKGGSGGSNLLVRGGVMYEPIVDTEKFSNVNRYGCTEGNVDMQDSDFIVTGIMDPVTKNLCNLNYNLDRMNIHSRNILVEDAGKRKKKGHFNHLAEEWRDVNNYLEDTDEFEDLSGKKNYDNPHYIEAITDLGVVYDGVSYKSLAYRKLLYKNIKITNEGQKFGQLYKPKGIAFDDDLENKDGQKYYVVDTYHHCIQCFEYNGTKKTVDGVEIDIRCADEELNEEMGHYLYDINVNAGVQYSKYNRSKMYALGIRQKVLDSAETGGKSTLLNKHRDWVLANGQVVNKKPYVYLFRWLSGHSEYGNQLFDAEKIGDDKNVDYDKIKDPFFYTEIRSDNFSSYPGCGEFLYPSDILITKNPFTGEKLLMVADMGNNRVSIFKKYSYQDPNGDLRYRFRFFRFLHDKEFNNNAIIAPLSITCCKNTGRIFVLTGTIKESTAQKIIVFKPALDNNKYLQYQHKINYELDGKGNTFNTSGNYRCVRITIDNRGLLACVYHKKYNQTQQKGDTETEIKFINANKKKIELTNMKNEAQVRLNNVYFNFNALENYQISQINDDENSLNRFRIFSSRINDSVLDSSEEYLLSLEYQIDTVLKSGQNNKLQYDVDKMKLQYTFKDGYQEGPYDNYWSIVNPNSIKEVPGDLVNNNINPPQVKPMEFNKYLNVNKVYLNEVVEGNYVRTLYNDINWLGKSIMPNTSYRYIFGIYDYNTVSPVKDENDVNNIKNKVFPITTIPLGIESDQVLREFKVDPKTNAKSIELRLSYGQLSRLHYETQKFNPLYCYVFRKEHNRTRDVTTRYVNLKKGQAIQIIVPAESKFIYSNFSKPKFGKLYIFNAYSSGNIFEQNNLMQENKYYKPDHLMIFYSAEGGEQQIPSKDRLGGNTILDDFFTLGDDPFNIYTQVKFRVRISLEQLDTDVEPKIIEFNNPKTINNFISNYSKDKGRINEHSLIFVKKTPLFKFIPNEDDNYKYLPEIVIQDKGNAQSPIHFNKTYEYYVMIGNQERINSAINSFYVTTKPSIPYFNKKGLEKVEMIKEGKKLKFLKIEWFTPKNENLYWPFNFIVCRRVFKNSYKPLQLADGKVPLNPDFTNKDGYVRIKDAITDLRYFKYEFTNEDGSWRLSLLMFGENQVGKDKELILKNSDLNNRDAGDRKIYKDSYKTTGSETYEVLSQHVPIRVKYYNVKTKKHSVTGWSWNEKQNYTEIANASKITLEIPLVRGFTLNVNTIKCEETYIETDDTEVIANNNSNAERQEEIKAIKKEMQKKKIRLLQEENKRRQKKKALGEVFLLSDDYEDIERSNYGGFGGELYLYLKDKSREELLKIFDNLHQDLIIYEGDVTMRMEGPAGMLRSGNTDMLIDKIRYMSQILRTKNQGAMEVMKMDCDTTSIRDLFNSNDEDMSPTNKICKSKKQIELEKKKQEIEEKKTEVLLEVEKQQEVKKQLEQQITTLQTDMQNKQQAITEEQNKQLDNLNTQLKEENEKLKNNKNLNEKIKELDKLTQEANKLGEPEEEEEEQEQKKGGLMDAIPIGQDEDNDVIPKNIHKIDDKNSLLGAFKESLNITRVMKNRSYIGNYGGFYGAKMINVDLKTWMEDASIGYETNALIRKEHQEMYNLVYDFNRRELSFVLPGEKVIDNLENLRYSKDKVVIFMNDGLSPQEIKESMKEEITKKSENKIEDIEKEILKMEEDLKKVIPPEEIKKNPDVVRLTELKKQLAAKKDVGVSEWSFIKQGKNELFVSTFPDEKEVEDILQNYGIKPTPVSLSSKIVKGKDLFDEEALRALPSAQAMEIENKEYITHHQFIEISEYDPKPYQYCIGTYQTGFSFNKDDKKVFMGMDYLTKLLNKEDLLDNEQMPVLNHGGTYSKVLSVGEPIQNTPEVLEVTEELEIAYPPAPPVPIIKSFSPKEGLQNSVVQVIGLELDKIEYFCFRDVKATILKTDNILIEEGGKNVMYNSVLLKVPTLKELGKECWQSLRPYEVLLWGYFKDGGRQIRTQEGDDLIGENRTPENIKRLMMFRYMDRVECPDNQKLKFEKN